MDCVYDGLYISGIEAIRKQKMVKDEGITAIVRLDTGTYGNFEWSRHFFNVLHEPFLDGDYIPEGVIPKITKFIHEQVENDGVVLVHCAMGVSRSTSLTIAYLIEYEGMSLAEAFGTIRENRTQAFPHPKMFASLISHYKLPYDPIEAMSPNFIGRLMQDA
ncbi:MAG: dual specificity protein phosphatase [Anaerolineae bacterium]|nr:dual specificity protein phosphatase [Anaerolineae bacterium]